MTALILGGAIAAALAAVRFAAASARRPCEELAAVARRMAAGDYGARTRGRPGGQLSVLAETLDALAARLEESEEVVREKGRLSAVLEQMAEGVVAVDEEGRVLLVNPALSRLLGVDPAQARGRGHLESLRHHGLAELLDEVRGAGRRASREITLFAPEELVFEAHAAPLAQDGRPAGALVVLHDITRLRRLELMRRDFVANVSHELRTPLASIKGYAETLRNGALEDRENRLGFVETIEEEADRLSKLVDDLLSLSAVESGHRPPRAAAVELEPLLEAAARGAAREAAERGARLTVLPCPGARARCDAGHVRQILANLVDNAVKYSEPGGPVELAARLSGGEAVVSVRDAGAGIPEADQPRVFERFFRVDRARSRDAGGTGLGLAIVKHLVEAQGGRVWLESRQPGGSTFFFSLPAA